MTRLVVGLGNPGKRYRESRHNVGAMVADELASRSGVRFKKARFIPMEWAELPGSPDRALVAKPISFMNESGPPVASLVKRNRVDAADLIVCHDDIDLPFGALKLKMGGSTAGHHGLDSLVAALRTPDFVRVRLGIGRPRGRGEPADFVLEPFSKAERGEVEVLVEDAAGAVMSILSEGLEFAQNRYTRGGAV